MVDFVVFPKCDQQHRMSISEENRHNESPGDGRNPMSVSYFHLKVINIHRIGFFVLFSGPVDQYFKG